MNNENDFTEIYIAIFTLHGIKNKNKIKIKHVDNIKLKKQEYIKDTFIKKFDLISQVYGEIYHCNITNNFLMISKKLPMYYINIILEKPFRKILLFRIYLFFTIETNIKSSKDLLENDIDGKFNLEISINNINKDLDNNIIKYPGDEELFNDLIIFTKNNEMIELTKNLANDIDIMLKNEYIKEFEYLKPPKNVISLKNYKFDTDQ